MIKIIQRRKTWYALSLVLTVASIAAIATWGLKLGIDYTGGTMMEVTFTETGLEGQEIKDALTGMELGDVSVQSTENNSAILRFKDVDEATHQAILTALNEKVGDKVGVEAPAAAAEDPVQIEAQTADGEDAVVEATAVTDTGDAAAATGYVTEKRFESTGPVIGDELKRSTLWAILISMIGIICYIGWAFRKISYPVSSFKYGFSAIIALLHDVIIMVGCFAAMGHFYGTEIGVTFLAAILAILGYSVNDTIVVFDRTRENLLRGRLNDFEEIVNNSVNETFVRSINASFTTLLMLFTMYCFGGASIQSFVLALIIGISFGTYSSVFIASPLLVTFQQYDMRRRK